LGERFNGIEEVVGSIPSGSTTQRTDIRRLLAFAKVRVISGTCADMGQNSRQRQRKSVFRHDLWIQSLRDKILFREVMFRFHETSSILN